MLAGALFGFGSAPFVCSASPSTLANFLMPLPLELLKSESGLGGSGGLTNLLDPVLLSLFLQGLAKVDVEMALGLEDDEEGTLLSCAPLVLLLLVVLAFRALPRLLSSSRQDDANCVSAACGSITRCNEAGSFRSYLGSN